MPRRDDVPQTAGDAIDYGWSWLRARCAYCRRETRVMLADRQRKERLGSTAARLRCTRCVGMTGALDYALGHETRSVREKLISFEGLFARKLGMN